MMRRSTRAMLRIRSRTSRGVDPACFSGIKVSCSRLLWIQTRVQRVVLNLLRARREEALHRRRWCPMVLSAEQQILGCSMGLSTPVLVVVVAGFAPCTVFPDPSLGPWHDLMGCRGLMVKALGWQSFDRQFEPCLRAIMAAPL
jgi:hypothetical protein